MNNAMVARLYTSLKCNDKVIINSIEVYYISNVSYIQGPYFDVQHKSYSITNKRYTSILGGQ